MQRMKRSAVSAAAAPILAVLLLSSCGGGSAGNGPVGVDTAIANVTDAQLKGTQISLARFFGDCTDQVGTTNTDVSKAVGECPAIQTLTNKFNAENKWGIKVTRLGGAAWDSYYLTLNAAIAGGNPPGARLRRVPGLPATSSVVAIDLNRKGRSAHPEDCRRGLELHRPRAAARDVAVTGNLSSPVTVLPGVSRATQTKLQALGIECVRDLIYHFPHRYDDF